jgi:hypothetical protein
MLDDVDSQDGCHSKINHSWSRSSRSHTLASDSCATCYGGKGFFVHRSLSKIVQMNQPTAATTARLLTLRCSDLFCHTSSPHLIAVCATRAWQSDLTDVVCGASQEEQFVYAATTYTICTECRSGASRKNHFMNSEGLSLIVV